MRFLLKYYYQIENPIISRKQNNIYIKEKNNKFLLCEIEKPDEFIEMVDVIEDNHIHFFYKIVKTKDNSLYIYYKEKIYTLIEIKEENRNISEILTNIGSIKIDNIYNKYEKINRSNWYFLWSKKNDYFSNIYSTHLHTNISEMQDYYMGMAETAIQYLNEVKENYKISKQLYVSHKRVKPNMFLNPVNLVLDHKERDIAEYIKYLFYSCEFTSEKIKMILERIKNENINVELVYARVLYPTNFFDIYERKLESKDVEQTCKITTKEIDNYEKYLKDLYTELSKIKKIKKIDWL